MSGVLKKKNSIIFNFRGKKKLEKALFQSQQDVMHLTEKLVGVQSGMCSQLRMSVRGDEI